MMQTTMITKARLGRIEALEALCRIREQEARDGTSLRRSKELAPRRRRAGLFVHYRQDDCKNIFAIAA